MELVTPRPDERIADALEALTDEVRRARIALEVLAGDALERELCRESHPSTSEPIGAGELRHIGRLGPEQNGRLE